MALRKSFIFAKNYLMRKFLSIFLLLLLCFKIDIAIGQIGGQFTYPFLNFSNSSRYAALGGNLVSIKEDDIALAQTNPSYISPLLHKTLATNFCDYFTTTSYGNMAYSHHFKKAGSFLFSLQAIGYGTFLQTDESGNSYGNFSAGDYVFGIGWGRALDSNFSMGANLKWIYSTYETYNSLGIATDVAASYYNSQKQISLSLLVKNIGSQLKPYTYRNFEPLPFDIQLAFSQRLEHIPIRYHITLHSLYKWNMAYIGDDNPLLEIDGISGNPKKPTATAHFFDNMFRHFVFGIEILPIKYLSFQIAYNQNRHQEMKIPQSRSFAGFSYGFLLEFYGMQLAFSRAHFAAGATPNYFTFTINMDKFAKTIQQRKTTKLQRLND